MATKVEVAKLFAKLGFEIDTSQLEKFEQLTRGVRASTVKLARDLRATNNQLTSVSSKLKSVNSSLNSVGSKKGAQSLATSYASLSKNVNITQTNMTRFSATLTATEPKLNTQVHTIVRLTSAWRDYASQVREANRQLRDRPPNPPPRPNGRGGAGGAGGGGTGAGGAGGSGRGGGFGAGMAGGALARMAGHFINPAYMAVGATAYAAKQVITTGRDFTAMKQILLASSKDTEDFNRNLEYTRKVTGELGTNVIEFGKAYAKTIQSVGDKLPRKQTEQMFRQFSELMVVMHSSDDDQKGVFRAMSQMFSKGKVQMEEINQMAERNVPALAMMTRAYKELGMTQAEFEKAQREGKLDPAKFLPLMGKYASEFARNNGALKKAMESSVTQQGLFMNRMRELSNQIMEAGLDKALGDMFKGLTKLAEALTPVVVWLTKATLGLAEFIKWIYAFAKAHPVITAVLVAMIGGLVGLRIAFRAGITMGGAFFMAMVRGLTMLKMAMLRTAVLAIFIAIAEVLVALYEHMNGEKNWLSVTIMWLRVFGSEVELAYQKFLTLMTAIRVGIKDSVIGEFFRKVFNMDFSSGISGETAPKQPVVINPDLLKAVGAPAPSANEKLNNFKQNTGFVSTVPTADASKVFGTMNVNYKMEVVNGKNQFVMQNQQKVNVGGLQK